MTCPLTTHQNAACNDEMPERYVGHVLRRKKEAKHRAFRNGWLFQGSACNLLRGHDLAFVLFVFSGDTLSCSITFDGGIVSVDCIIEARAQQSFL